MSIWSSDMPVTSSHRPASTPPTPSKHVQPTIIDLEAVLPPSEIWTNGEGPLDRTNTGYIEIIDPTK